jgi:hypothetical protein
MRKFMLRLVGIYAPFVMIILGIGACSFTYKDTIFDKLLKNNEEVIEEPATVIEEAPVTEPEPTVDDNPPPAEEPVYEPGIPEIGECVCPEATGTLS